MNRMITVLGLVLVYIMLGTAPAQAADGTWTNTAGGTWSTAANWSGGTIADSAGSLANFSTVDITASRTITLDTSRTIGRLLFGDLVWNSTSYDWTLSSSGGSILTLDNSGGTGGNPPSITVSNRTTTIGTVLAGTNGLTLKLPWSSYDSTRGTTVAYGGGAMTETAGALSFTNINTLSNALNVVGGTVSVGGGVGKFGNVTSLTVAGNGAFTNGDSTAANNCGVVNRIGDGTASLTLGGATGGGTFVTAFPTNATTASQTFASLTVNAGQNVLNTNNTAAGTLNLAFTGTGGAGYVRGVNGLLNVVSATGFTPSFANAPTAAGGSSVSGTGGYETLVGGILNGNDFIKAAAGNLGAATYYTTTSGGNTAANYNGVNMDVTSSPTLGGAITVNSIRFANNAAYTVTLTGANTITNGGILTGGAVATTGNTITGGSITSAQGDLWIYANGTGLSNPRNANTALTIASKITGNISLTVGGGQQVTLTGANDYTGGTFLMGPGGSSGGWGGSIAVNADGALGAANGTVTAVSGFSNLKPIPTTLTFSSSRNFVINSGATLGISCGTTATIPGQVSGGGQLQIGYVGAGGLLLILTGNNNGFTGQYLVNSFLRADQGTGLSTNANLMFTGRDIYNSGVLETSGTFSRPLGSGAGQVQWQNAGGYAGGGFAAVGGPLTVNIGGNVTPDTLTIGSGYFIPSNGALNLGDANSTHDVTFQNPIALNGAQRIINVAAAGTTKATMSGVLSGNASSGIIKYDTGTLVLPSINTYMGQTTLWQGTLSVASLNSVVGGSVSSSLGAPTNATSGTIILGDKGGGGPNNANLTYTGSGETTDRILQLMATMGQITLNHAGTGLWKFTSPLVSAGMRRTTESTALILDGSTAGTGELAGSFADGMYTVTVAAAVSGTNQLTVLTAGVDQNYGWARDHVWVSGDGIAPGSYWTAFSGWTGTLNQVTTAGLTNGQPVFLRGSDSLSKTGSGTWTLSGANTYSGGTTISGGTLQIGNGGASGTIGLGWVTNNAALVFNRSDNVTVSNNIAGTGTVVFAGTGTTTLLGTNTYSGATVISNGTLQVGNGGALVSLGSGPVTNNGALVINHSDSVYLGSLSGTGRLTQAGSGTLTIGQTEVGPALTRVSGGVLKIAAIPPDPLIYYNFDNASISGTTVTNFGTGGAAYNGVLAGNNMTNATGKLGQAIMTTNSTGMATANTVTIPNAVTLAAWVKSSGITPQYQRIINNKFDLSVYIGTDNNNKFCSYIVGTQILTTQSSSDTSNWHHVAMTWDGSHAIFYYDGTALTNVTLASKNIATSTLKFGFGNNSVTNGECWNGALDEAYVFGRALSSNEVAALALTNASPVPATASYQVDAGAMLDLGGSTNQQVAGLSGSGVVTNGSLAVSGTLAPGGTNAIGTLTVQGSLVVGANTVLDWNFNDTTNDVIVVNGALTVPAVATVNVSRVSGTLPVANPAVLFSASGTPTINGAANLNQWVILGTVRADTRAVVRGNQVQLVRSTGMLLEIY